MANTFALLFLPCPPILAASDDRHRIINFHSIPSKWFCFVSCKPLKECTASISFTQVGHYVSDFGATHLVLTDIKPDNILFNIGEDPVSMESYLATEPPMIDGEVELNGTSYPVMLPQPLFHDFVWNDTALTVELYDFVLNDVGSGAFVILKVFIFLSLMFNYRTSPAG
jgi:hypothetical protein